jgi:hypothetical protein
MESVTLAFTSLQCLSTQVYPETEPPKTLSEKRLATLANLERFGGAEKLLPLATKEN